jgi:hypothetical protein
MYINNAQREFLAGLKAGDLVVVSNSFNGWSVRHVSKVTAARVWVGRVQFDRKTGCEWVRARVYARSELYPLTAECIEEARKEGEARKALVARRELLEAISTDLDTATISTLEQIRDLLASSNAAGTK